MHTHQQANSVDQATIDQLQQRKNNFLASDHNETWKLGHLAGDLNLLFQGAWYSNQKHYAAWLDCLLSKYGF